MGFWHTGYMEFHEPVGLDERVDVPHVSIVCPQCHEVLDEIYDLRTHIFERHPTRRPSLYLRGREIGAHPMRIARALTVGDVATINCDRALLNGVGVPVGELPQVLASSRSDVIKLTLFHAEVSSSYTLDFRIASNSDLRGIEIEFRKLVAGRRLDVRAVEGFISATEQFGTAIGYSDGICCYLYGILAKERAPDTTLPYAAYEGRFSSAAEALAPYDRVLSVAIRSLIEFHFNHFADAFRLAPESVVGMASCQYQHWLSGQAPTERSRLDVGVRSTGVERMLTDLETDRIVGWVLRAPHTLAAELPEIESMLKREIAEYDRVKLRILLAEAYVVIDDRTSALRHSRALRNLTGLGNWAERLIEGGRQL